MEATLPRRSWEVLLIGGASGSGKTSLSYRLARHFGVGITEADDIHQALMRMTTPAEHPLLHHWDENPGEVRGWPAERILEHAIAVCRELAPAFEAVIANHLETDIPLVLEGDYLLPVQTAQASFGGFANGGRVHGLFIHEDDEEQFVRNYLAREPASGRQELRSRVSWLHSRWLVEEAARAGAIILPSRPWETGLDRAIAALAE